MRRRGLIPLLAIVLVVAGCGTDGGATATAELPARSLTAGSVDVKISPVRLDDSGATFKITFDTHSYDLSLDVTKQARLEVGGTRWPARTWTGDRPGGHHREGELSFAADGPAKGVARLTITGLPERVTATWTLRA